ncbi:hypothetical protein GCM10007304_09830 [Rhodococcoides trifolii]|uniref:Peptidase M16 N-terminal domain-containing protein n=1 Tax=Rhodococcoides trifolii TaxID=908250 RepID=A0A917FS95_9NOCA|nr:insulinase family protein [Rhodococcus trifolii]GGF97921.1 hypothetical protein GCM10007304_09830 [Rhodococcus trifolii]
MIVSDVHCRNGIRSIVLDRPGSSAVEIASVVRAGSRHDPPGRIGTAHLTEHLLTVGADDVSRGVESVGGSFAATTHPDHMQFVTTAPAGLWNDLLLADVNRVHGRMMLQKSDIDAQRVAVAEEIRAAAASPSPWPGMTGALHGGDDALGHDGFGEIADLDRIDLAVCTRFVSAVVRPERAVIVVALDVSSAGGPARILDVVDSVQPAPAPAPVAAAGPVRDAYPTSTLGSPHTATGSGVTATWCGWSVPGLSRSTRDHLRWFGAAAVLEQRCAGYRFGRSGVGHVGDRETLAVAGGSVENILELLEAPVTVSEHEHARRRLRGAAVDFEHDPASIARLAAFTDAPTVRCPSLDRSDLDHALARLRSTTPAVVTPDPDAPVDRSARPSSAQAPQSTRRRPIEFVHNTIGSTARRLNVCGPHAAALEMDGPTYVCVRTPAPFRSPLWERVTDFSGHRYATRTQSTEQLAHALDHLPDTVSELAAVGADAGAALRRRVAPHRGDGISTRAGAARWLALGALNSVHRIALGHAPIVRVLRLPTRPHPTVQLVGDPGIDLHTLVDGWTPAELDRTRTFCAGQALSATATGRDTADLLLTLLCNDIRVDGDPVESFASSLLTTGDGEIRAAAHRVLEMTNVMSAGCGTSGQLS